MTINIKKNAPGNTVEWVNAIPKVKVSTTSWVDVKKIWVKKSATEWKSVYEQETVYTFPVGSGTALNPTVINDVDLGGNDADGNPYFTVDQKLKDCRVIIPAGVALVASTVAEYALKTGSVYGGKLTLQVDGLLLGRGGNGGAATADNGGNGSAGGPAVYVETNIYVEQSVNVYGGGGGGGAGPSHHMMDQLDVAAGGSGAVRASGAGGGGGAPLGVGGAGFIHNTPYQAKGNGDFSEWNVTEWINSNPGGDATLLSAGIRGEGMGGTRSPFETGTNHGTAGGEHGESATKAQNYGSSNVEDSNGNLKNRTGGNGGTAGEEYTIVGTNTVTVIPI